ncbi:hypothetical protein [Gandjariella thermophila]|uniref:hypothetical protein n=1 Tax=Gandjariella thermophila TaxID=1931992 RepID=UPI0010F7F616|nr:hypothetical protein [Gandjariella thermophila]
MALLLEGQLANAVEERELVLAAVDVGQVPATHLTPLQHGQDRVDAHAGGQEVAERRGMPGREMPSRLGQRHGRADEQSRREDVPAVAAAAVANGDLVGAVLGGDDGERLQLRPDAQGGVLAGDRFRQGRRTGPVGEPVAG